MRVMKFISVAVALAILLTLAIAQQAAPAQNGTSVKHVPITKTSPTSGRRCSTAIVPFAMGRMARAGGQQLPR